MKIQTLLTAVLLTVSGFATAQGAAYPERPITAVVGKCPRYHARSCR